MVEITKEKVLELIKSTNLFVSPKIEYLGSGESNTNFLIYDGDEKKAVIRYSIPSQFKQSSLYNEYKVLKLLEAEGISFAPRSIYYSDEDHFHIIEYLEGEVIRDLRKLSFRDYEDITEYLAEMYFVKKPDNFSYEYIEDTYRKYCLIPYMYIKKNCVDENILKFVTSNFHPNNFRFEMKCLIHGDIENNIIRTNKGLYFIDWELSRFIIAPSEFGFVYFAENLTKKQKKILLEKYCYSTNFDKKKLVYYLVQIRKFVLFNDVLWAAQRYTELILDNQDSSADYYLKLTHKRIKKFEKFIKEEWKN